MRRTEVARNILAGIGAITIAVIFVRVIVPLFVVEGVIDEGSYRGLEIGAAKGEVALLLTGASDRFSRLALDGYAGKDGKFRSLFYDEIETDRRIIDSDVWYVRYPGMHQENLSLHFKDGRLFLIRYSRAIMDP